MELLVLGLLFLFCGCLCVCVCVFVGGRGVASRVQTIVADGEFYLCSLGMTYFERPNVFFFGSLLLRKLQLLLSIFCAFCFSAAHIWNSLPFALHHSPSLPAFKTSLK